MGIYFGVEPDAGFAVYRDERVILRNCYPGINGVSVRPINLKINDEKTELYMETVYGKLFIRLGRTEAGAVISARISKCAGGIYCFSPIYHAEIPEAEGVYQVSGETGDDTGFYSMETVLEKRKFKSAGICPIKLRGGAVTLFFKDFRHYSNYFFITCEEKKLTVTAETTIENVCGAELAAPDLYIESTELLQDGLQRAAAGIADEMEISLGKPPSYNWCSWYYCYHDFDQAQLREYLEGFRELPESRDIRYFLIDAGYCVSLGDWLTCNWRWKDGLKAAFETVKEYGYQPAVWIGPYMVGNRSRLYQEHPDWILYTTCGAPVRMLITDNEPKLWDYQDEEYYVLDTSHPDAFAYMRQVFRTLRGWGVRMFKTDFMVWGIQDSSMVKRYCPGKTSVEYFREFLQMIREEIGQESYWLGCIAPFFPFLGYADGMRIGGDVGSSWDGRFGPQNMIRSIAGNCFMNHVFYENDPDVVMLRDFHIRLNEEEIESLALLQAVSGGSIYTSDPLHLIDTERRELFRFIRPFGRRNAIQPFLHQERQEVTLLQRKKGKALLYILNPGEKTLKEQYHKEELGFSGICDIVKVSGRGCFGEIKEGGLWFELRPHHHLLLLITASGTEDGCERIQKSHMWAYLE